MEDLPLTWFAEHGRDLPRRKTRDPYAILVREVMRPFVLQQPFAG